MIGGLGKGGSSLHPPSRGMATHPADPVHLMGPQAAPLGSGSCSHLQILEVLGPHPQHMYSAAWGQCLRPPHSPPAPMENRAATMGCGLQGSSPTTSRKQRSWGP